MKKNKCILLMPTLFAPFITVGCANVSDYHDYGKVIPKDFFDVQNGVLYGFKENITSRTIRHGKYSVLQIPKNVEQIAPNAFLGMFDGFANSIEHVVFNKKLKFIGTHAFSQCYGLKGQLDLSNTNVRTIGSEAFYSCSSISKVTFPECIEEIQEKSFAFCDQISEITIPSNVTNVGTSAFFNCLLVDTIDLSGYQGVPQWVNTSHHIFACSADRTSESLTILLNANSCSTEEWKELLKPQFYTNEGDSFTYEFDRVLKYDADEEKNPLNITTVEEFAATESAKPEWKENHLGRYFYEYKKDDESTAEWRFRCSVWDKNTQFETKFKDKEGQQVDAVNDKNLILLEKDKKILLGPKEDVDLLQYDAIEIPKDVALIWTGAFKNVPNKKIRLLFENPDDESTPLIFWDSAFENNNSIFGNIELPKRCIWIGQNCFKNCQNISKVILPDRETGASNMNGITTSNLPFPCTLRACCFENSGIESLVFPKTWNNDFQFEKDDIPNDDTIGKDKTTGTFICKDALRNCFRLSKLDFSSWTNDSSNAPTDIPSWSTYTCVDNTGTGKDKNCGDWISTSEDIAESLTKHIGTIVVSETNYTCDAEQDSPLSNWDKFLVSLKFTADIEKDQIKSMHNISHTITGYQNVKNDKNQWLIYPLCDVDAKNNRYDITSNYEYKAKQIAPEAGSSDYIYHPYLTFDNKNKTDDYPSCTGVLSSFSLSKLFFNQCNATKPTWMHLNSSLVNLDSKCFGEQSVTKEGVSTYDQVGGVMFDGEIPTSLLYMDDPFYGTELYGFLDIPATVKTLSMDNSKAEHLYGLRLHPETKLISTDNMCSTSMGTKDGGKKMEFLDLVSFKIEDIQKLPSGMVCPNKIIIPSGVDKSDWLAQLKPKFNDLNLDQLRCVDDEGGVYE